MKPRISKQEYYLDIAKAVSERSPCLRRQIGAIIVNEDVIVSTGYNGPPRGVINCLEIGCLKDKNNLPSYSGYDFCIGVHAEENSVINAARNGSSINNGYLYLCGQDYNSKGISDLRPCDRCKRVLINSGIKKVFTRKPDNSVEELDVEGWIDEESRNYKKRMEE
jgi:dCMP deaminase